MNSDAKLKEEMLICIGIEHSKARILSKKLFELGYDPDAILMEEL